MQAPEVEVEWKKGKTYLVNLGELSEILGRKPEHITKWFGCELAELTHYDREKKVGSLNGKHQANRLRGLLFSFMEKYCICDFCHSLQTDLIIHKTSVRYHCLDCDFRGEFDNKHKMATIIVNTRH